MDQRKIGVRTALSIAMAITIVGCSGGSDTAAPAPVLAATTTISGTAASGAPFGGAAISVLDKTGTVVGSGTSAADGSFTITLKAGSAGPFVLQAVRDDQTLVSVAPDATSGVINITPITNLIASRLGTSGDPTKLAAEFLANPNLLTSFTVSAKVAEIVALLKPLLDALGATGSPLTTAFAANGTGTDRVLDSLSIKITPASATTSNIEVSVRQADADGVQPTVVQFSNATTAIPPLPPVTAANLVKPGTAPLIAALLAKMNACYALPVADRVNVPESGVATDIKAAACKEIFVNNDPTAFKSNGNLVAANGAFGNIFKAGGNNLVFDRGTYEFTRPNGDIVIGYRATDASGNVTNDTFAVRPDVASAPTKLQQIGNQYIYDGAIKPYHQLRTFVNQRASDYYSTGYVPAVNNTLNNGNPIFSKVVVTTPKGGTLTLKPKSGFGTLQLDKAGTVTGTSFLRMRSVYVSPDKVNLDPAADDTALYFASPASTDADITGFAQQSVWKFDYYLAGNASTTPDATQNYRTRARALSISELKLREMANLTDVDLTELVALSSANKYFDAPTTGPTLDWTVGAGALAPTSLTVWGGVNGANAFNDSLTVGSTARTATIPCVKKTNADAHCTGTVVNAASTYVAAAKLNGLHLFARDPVGREFAHFYATYLAGNGAE
ncbi:MAG: hypothetical protein JWR22_2285 [Herminiimonas sp.]|nr:hypothetical protein [Herminiimonas sp.]